MEAEGEALAAYFEGDFEEGRDPRDGKRTWRIVLNEAGATLVLKLPPGYPETEAPSLAMEFEQWPVGGDEFAARMRDEVAEQWDPGEGCACTWAEHVKEALSNGPAEFAGARSSSVPASGDVGSSEVGVQDAEQGGGGSGVGSVPLGASQVPAVEAALLAAGFRRCGPGLFSHGERGVTVEVGEMLTITVDGIDADDLSDWATLQLETDANALGARLVEWVTAQRSAEPGFLEDEEEGDTGEALDFLPSAEELGVKKDRDLLIYTWGKALRKAAPADSECNFNAGILNGRGGGADLRTMNGLSDEIQNNVASCGLFPRWISMVCHKVEFSGLHTISINCTKGRHRSVAAAEILRRLYYPQAAVRHLTIS